MMKQIGDEDRALSNHNMAILYQVKNDMQRRAEMQDREMRVKADGDVNKSTGYLHIALVKMGWPKIKIRGIGRAVET